MSRKSINDVLKQREAEKKEAERKAENTLISLDDTERIKVLSPARLVFKRFVRNRLAIVGTCILVLMFAMSFIGPLLYPYKQTEKFYKYDVQTTEYASAVERAEYANFIADSSVDIHRSVRNNMNSYISAMEKDGSAELIVTDANGEAYRVKKLGDNIYALYDAGDLIGVYRNIFSLGSYNTAAELVSYSEGEENRGPAFMDALKGALEDKKASFEHEGITYMLESDKKNYRITYIDVGKINYSETSPGNGFEEAASGGLASGTFIYNGSVYTISRFAEGEYRIFGGGAGAALLISSTFVFDTYDHSINITSEFKNKAFLAAYGERTFTCDGVVYNITEEEGTLYIYKKGEMNEAFAILSTFVVRRYTGEDNLTLDFKGELQAFILEMEDAGKSAASGVFLVEKQNQDSTYAYDENGRLLYEEKELKITRKVSTYVVTAERILYLENHYSRPLDNNTLEPHIIGTDGDGYDIFARMMYGGRISLAVGFVVIILETILGIIMGGIAGFFGGWVDTLIMRLVDVFYCIPSLPILIILGAMFDALQVDPYIRLAWLMAVLGFLGWAGVARLVRGQILSLREQDFMVAAESTGLKTARRIFKHLIPNVMPQLIVSATMGLGGVIITESTLSYLGLGVRHPLATWGTMINSVSDSASMQNYTYIWIPVGCLICLTVIAFNFVGDGLRDAFDPKTNR